MIIPLAKLEITSEERGNVNEILRGDVLTPHFVEDFELSWSKINGRSYGVACNSGTSAIFLALKALGIGPGDEVLVPEFTMIAAAHAVSWTGAKPVFVDCSAESTNMDPDLIVIGEKTKAILVTPIYGRPVSPRIYKIAKAAGIYIVEDFAEAHGIKPRGDITCYSFYFNKIISTEEGGMCLTDRKDWLERMRSLRNFFFDKERTMLHSEMGYNLRMSNLHAAIGLAQAKRFKEITAKRIVLQDLYDQHINPIFKLPKREVLWMYDIRVDDPAKMIRKLKNHSVPARRFFKPMSAQPMYAAPYEHLHAHKWSESGIYLPVYNDMTPGDIRYICRGLE